VRVVVPVRLVTRPVAWNAGAREHHSFTLPNLPDPPAAAVEDGGRYSRLASNLEEGTWLEFRDEKRRHLVKLSYVSPFRAPTCSTRQGRPWARRSGTLTTARPHLSPPAGRGRP
jgi:hypothetical protein